MRTAGSFVLLWMLTASTAAAAAEDGNDGVTLLRACQAGVSILEEKPVTDPGSIFGAGYCKGVVWTIFVVERDVICWPEGAKVVTPEQVVRIVHKFLVDHPARLHELGVALTINALAEAFPCRDQP